MSDQVYNKLIVVFDETTHGIVCTAHSDAHAHALIQGTINCKFVSLSSYFHPKAPGYNLNFNDASMHYRFTPTHEVEPLPSKFSTQEWTNFRALMLKKSYFLGMWEFRIRQNLNRINDYYGLPNMMSFLIDQLNKCDPNSGYYTSAITEWAEIQECSPEAAYQELKLRQEGYGLVYLRSNALYSKYVRKISQATTEAEVKDYYDQGWTDLLKKAQI